MGKELLFEGVLTDWKSWFRKLEMTIMGKRLAPRPKEELMSWSLWVYAFAAVFVGLGWFLGWALTFVRSLGKVRRLRSQIKKLDIEIEKLEAQLGEREA